MCKSNICTVIREYSLMICSGRISNKNQFLIFLCVVGAQHQNDQADHVTKKNVHGLHISDSCFFSLE